MDLRSVNYEELLDESYIPKPILEARFPVESASSEPSQAEPSQAEPSQAELSTSSMALTELRTGMSFTILMGKEVSIGSTDFAIWKLLEAVKFVIDVRSIGRLFNKPAKEAAALQTVAEEIVPASVEVLTLPVASLLTKEPIVPAVSTVLREEVPVAERPGPKG